MSVFSIIYIILLITLLIYAIKNRLDLLCVGAVCFIVYSIYCIPGIGISGFYRPQLSSELYCYIYVQIIIILNFLFAIRHQIKIKNNKKINQNYSSSINICSNNQIIKLSFYVYTTIMVGFALINVLKIGISGFASGKSTVWEQSNVFYIISLYGAYASFAYGIHNHEKMIWIPSLLIELTIFFAGSRAFTATLIIIFLCEQGSNLWKNHKSNIKIFTLGGLAIIFLLVYRMIDQHIMSGNISGAIQTLLNPSTWLTALEFNEPRVIIANYDYVLTTETRLPIGDIIYRFIDFIPGLTSLIPITLVYPDYFSTWLEEQVHASAGVGGTIWGESYAMFGFIGIIIFTIIWLFMINACNKHLDYPKSHSYFIVALGAYLSWYINRLDFNRVGQACKVMFFCFLLWTIIYLILGGKLKLFNYEFYIGRYY